MSEYQLYLNLDGIKYKVKRPEKEDLSKCIKFTSDTAFTFAFDLTNADSTIEYSLDNITWNAYTSKASISVDNSIYLRGTGGTHFGSSATQTTGPFTITNATNLSVSGNINALLDYQTDYTTLPASYTFRYLFRNLTSLVSAKDLILPATALTNYSYQNMFRDCTSLTSAPELPATTLASYCYAAMFYGCTSLTSAPALPATTLASRCYAFMFYGCTSLKSAPALPATTLASSCYEYMFYNCSSLTSAPALPATTLASDCYYHMFYNCSSLTSAPALPATTLASRCYLNMFYNCSSLTSAPELPATTLKDYCYYEMFRGCTSLKLSTTQTSVYKTAYRIPTTGTGTTTSNALTNMFTNTGGTFTGTPTINTTYYGAW